ncbi:unnamed protein product [Calypogeia fissa]
MYNSAGSRKVWTIGLNGYTKTKSEILKLMYCTKPSSREVAVSWFVKALVKRVVCIWKKQVLLLKRHRQNHWYAVVHSKMQCLLKGFLALRENVDAKQSKQSLQELSVNCYHQNLKRKTVSGCKFLHQTKRVKLVQIEHATAQWRTAKLQERFGKWRCRLLKNAITSLMHWHEPQVEFSFMEEDQGLPKTTGISRKFHSWDAMNTQRSASAMPARPQPRRPAFLYEDGAQPQAQNVQGERNGKEKRSPGGWIPKDYPNLVFKEIEWMEHVLLDYEELKMHIVRLRAELALQLEQSSSDVNDGYDHKIQNRQDKSILLLQEEISALKAKKTVQRPLIHAVLSRIQDLQAREIPDT